MRLLILVIHIFADNIVESDESKDIILHGEQ
jgi:hypothetical protein